MSETSDREAAPLSPAPDSPSGVGVRPRGAKICGMCGFAQMVPTTACPNCNAPQPDGAKTLVIDGRYRVEAELGRGGMGIVYLAKDTWLDRPVALKMIAPIWAGNSSAAASFHREARALASIRSQYVVQVYAFGPHEGSYFFAMEYVRGRTLRQILAEHREHGDTVPIHRTLTILSRVAQGIDAVHAAGIVHRDVKPANIVIEEDTGRAVLVDFGLAVPSEDPSAALSIGTPQYMAPEQAGVGVPGATVTPRTDVYALGIIAFEMLTGQLPFESTDLAQLMRMHARRAPVPLSSLRRDLLPFEPVVARALAKDPADRYASCTEMASALAAAGTRWVNSTMPTLPPPAIEEDRPLHVLVVDDDPIFRKFAAQAAQLALFRHQKDLRVVVKGAGSGREALERASVQPPDLVLLDFDMPGFDGLDTLSRLRALPGGDDARVIVVSGRVSAPHRWRFAVLGVNDFVSKPIDFNRLVDQIEGIVRRQEERQRGQAPAT